MEIKKVGVVGCGLMGHGIAQVAAQAGYEVVAARGRPGAPRQGARQDREAARRAPSRRASWSSRRPTRSAAGIQGTTDYDGLRGLRPRDRGDHREPRRRSARCGRSSTAIVKDGRRLRDQHVVAVGDRPGGRRPGAPNRFIGLHFFNPAQVMPLLEVVQTVTTDDGRASRPASRSADKLGKTRRAAARTRRASSSTGCSCRTCSTRSAPTRRASGSIEEIDDGDEGRRGPPDGPVHAARLRGPRHDRSRSRTSCSTSTARSASPRRRRCASWSRPASTAGSPARGFYDYSGEKPVAVDPGVSAVLVPRKN